MQLIEWPPRDFIELPLPRVIEWPCDSVVTTTATFDPRFAGSGRPLVRGKYLFKRRRGRPRAPLDQLVGHVLHLRALEPNRKLTSIVAAVAAFHKVGQSSVWQALQEHDPAKPLVVDFIVTSRFKTQYY
jgi:hypothetical protein